MKLHLALALLCVPAIAHADDVASHEDSLRSQAYAQHYEECLAEYEWLHGHGVADSTKIHSDDELLGLKAGDHSIAEVRDGCAREQRHIDVIAAARECLKTGKTQESEPTAEYAHDHGVGLPREDQVAGWLAAFAGEKDGDHFDYYGTDATFGDARKGCNTFPAWRKRLDAVVAAEAAAKAKAIEDKYKAAGVAGDKLKLFIEYDDVYWLTAPRCEQEDDPRTLAKARALFQWLDNADGTITIRRYAFSGNKVGKITSRTYRLEAQAYKGCK